MAPLSGAQQVDALPKSGDLLYLGRAASPQFGGDRGIRFRLIRVHDWSTYEGWVWLDGYQLDGRGDAIERRSVFVIIDGIQVIPNRVGEQAAGVTSGRRAARAGERSTNLVARQRRSAA